MAKQGISTGIIPNDGTGDTLLVAALKINENFNEIYSAIGNGTNITKTINNLTTTGVSTISGITVSSGIVTATDLVLTGNLTVNGSSTTINTETLVVEDKNIELSNITSPTDILADGGGITLRGTTNHTILWSNANNSWDFSENLNLVTGSVYRINNTQVLSSTTLGSGVVNSSLTSFGTVPTAIINYLSNININSSGITTASRFVSSVSTGTSPLTVTSTTKVANLNADLLDDQDSTYYTNATNISSGTLNTARLPSNISVSGITTASRFVSTVSTGTSPLTVTSTTKVANLNVDLLDDQDSTYYTNATNISSGTLDNSRLPSNISVSGITTASRFVSNVATGTSPLTVISTTKVANLNVDLLDDQDSTYYTNATNISSGTLNTARLPSNISVSGITTASRFASSVSTGTSPLTVISTTKVINLNADLLDDQDSTYYTNATNISSGTLDNSRLPQNISISGIITASNVAIGTASPVEKIEVVGGNIKVGVGTNNGLILTSENGTKYQLYVENDGTLKTKLA